METLPAKTKLTPKQERFVREYLVDLNATQAAIRAGYSQKTAKDIGCQNLAKLYIADAIAELRAERAGRLEISADNVLRELARLGFSNMGDYLDENGVPSLEGLTEDQTAALTEVSFEQSEHGGKVKFKLADKRGALQDLGKHLGLFEKDRAPVTVNVFDSNVLLNPGGG